MTFLKTNQIENGDNPPDTLTLFNMTIRSNDIDIQSFTM